MRLWLPRPLASRVLLPVARSTRPGARCRPLSRRASSRPVALPRKGRRPAASAAAVFFFVFVRAASLRRSGRRLPAWLISKL
eukprot:8025223-Alexandrium_andersonii.AAC.1